VFLAPAAWAHVGSPDIYADGQAGPYKLFVTIRPPLVIPGVAEIEVRSESDGIESIEIAPIPLTGEASKHPPVADAMKRSATDKQFFTGALWIMASGSWQVRFRVQGTQPGGGAVTGLLSIPVPATASSTRGMPTGLGVVLSGLGVLLVAGVVGIVGAAAGQAQLAPGADLSTKRRGSLIAMGVALALMAAAVILGKLWWNGEANDYAQYVYKPLTMDATVSQGDDAGNGKGSTLTLKIHDPGWLLSRKVNDFVLDHDHLMHLYAIREPGLDRVYHLHPEQAATGEFRLQLPAIAAGEYKLYADVVHATGFPETMVSSMTLPDTAGRPLAGDDAAGAAAPLNPAACSGDTAQGRDMFRLPDGYTMIWRKPPLPLRAKEAEVFTFSLLDPAGKQPEDMALYMGMLGHAAFVKSDGSVFAHVHPSGTVSMAALMMAAAQNAPQGQGPQETAKGQADGTGAGAMAAMPGMADSELPNRVGFPYGFPSSGVYRIFVQMKHGQTVETGIFDACVE
jgi:hypothetical protein